MSSLLTGDATSDASSRLALQGGAVAAWSRGCLVVATWLRVEPVIVDQTCDCGHAEHSGIVGVHVFDQTCDCGNAEHSSIVGVHVSCGICAFDLLNHMCPVYVFLVDWGRYI